MSILCPHTVLYTVCMSLFQLFIIYSKPNILPTSLFSIRVKSRKWKNSRLCIFSHTIKFLAASHFFSVYPLLLFSFSFFFFCFFATNYNGCRIGSRESHLYLTQKDQAMDDKRKNEISIAPK